MRIISWNCNGRFRDKFSYIQSYDADIYVIQECEDPSLRGNNAYKDFACNYLWIGENPNKGLGIFAKATVTLEPKDWPSYCLRCFLPVRINNSFDLLGVWACDPYIAEYYVYQCININHYNQDMVIIGDFNSNAIWDKKHGKRNHSTVVNELAEIGLTSAYHATTGERQGLESRHTFFQYRHLDKGFHIDHCFISCPRIKHFSILADKFLIEQSDHRPICLDIH